MIDKIWEFQKKFDMIRPQDKVIAGVSGGADSVCLLLVLKELQRRCAFELEAVHVEHGIRGQESMDDAAFAERFCRQQGIPCSVFHVDAPAMASAQKKTLEEAARELRYQCFADVCKGQENAKIAVAHHGDDCAETMLFHLCRGTGLRGLCGIPPVRGRIIRPLLCVTRKEIEAYLESRGQTFCLDSTNTQLQYARNRIRNCVMPQLEQINVQAVRHMLQTARMLGDVCEYLEEAAFEAGKKGLILSYGKEEEKEDPWGIRMKKTVFAQMPEVLQTNLLHRLMGMAAGSRKDITAVHVESLKKLFGAGPGKELSFPYGVRAVSEYEYVWIRNEKRAGGCLERTCEAEKTEEKELELSVPGTVFFGSGRQIRLRLTDFDGDMKKIPEKTYTKWFDYDKIKSNILLRKRRPGDFFVTDQKGGRKKIKDYFIDEKIPRNQRDSVWLLADGSHILWILGRRISEEYKVTQKTKRILEVCVDGGQQDERNNPRDVSGGSGK